MMPASFPEPADPAAQDATPATPEDAGTAKFAPDLREHVRLENEVLFPGFGG